MSAYKKLNKQDVYVTAYTARKTWESDHTNLVEYGIDVLRGLSGSIPYYPTPNDFRGNPPFAWIPSRYETPTYHSVKQLYYSNQLAEELYEHSSSFDNFEQSSFTVGKRNLETEVAVISIPQNIFGTHIEPHTFALQPTAEDTDYYVWYDESEDSGSYGLNPSYPTDYFMADQSTGEFEYVESVLRVFGSLPAIDCFGYVENEGNYVDESSEEYMDQLYNQHTFAIVDDGEGNLIWEGTDVCEYGDKSVLGNIIYTHGQVVITNPVVARYFSTYLRPEVNWKSNQPIYTYNVHCKVKDSEMNSTLNPSALSGSYGDLHTNVAGGTFAPYVSTVGLYNDANELVAVAKMGQPVPKALNTDMTFVVKIDM